MKKELIAHRNPKSPISEIFRTLRTNIQFMNSNKELKTLLVTSTVPSEGKSWVSSNLAITFAQAGLKVILIDADMRKGRLHNLFEIISRPGLSNYLSGVTETNQEKGNIANFVRETDVPNLYVMPAGNIPPNPSELLVTPQMIILLEELKRQSDLIIIDGTPAKLVTDSVILSRIVDSTIVVAAHNQTKKDEIEKTVKDIKNVGGNVAGVVYNKVPIQAKKYSESYYYVSDAEFKNIPTSRKYETPTRRAPQKPMPGSISSSVRSTRTAPTRTPASKTVEKIEEPKIELKEEAKIEIKEEPKEEVKATRTTTRATRKTKTAKEEKEPKETKTKTTRTRKTTTKKATTDKEKKE